MVDGLIDLERSEIYTLLFPSADPVSPDHARKSLRILDLCLEADRNVVFGAEKTSTPTKATISINNDGSQNSSKIIEMSENDIKDVRFLLNAHGYDSSLWDIVNAKSSIWDTQVKGGIVKTLYSSQIAVKPKMDGISLDKLEEWFYQFDSKKVDWKEYQIDSSNDNCLILPIADLHFNLLASAFISGSKYNKEIATDNFYHIISDVIKRTNNKPLSKIVFVLGNDMFNADGINGATYRGTPQDNEGHIFEAFLELSSIVIKSIEFLTNTAPVDVIFVPSNHDKETAYYFMINLHTYFRENKNVFVDYSPLPRKYYRFGKTLFMFTHDLKIADVAKTFLDEGGEYLSEVEYYDCFLAHLHSESVTQDKNLTIRRLSTTSGNSTWTTENNYSAKRVHQSFIYNDKDGLTDCLYTMV